MIGKKTCASCHFLVKEYREENTGRVLEFSPSEEERKNARSDPDGFLKSHYSLKCLKGVWDEGVGLPPGGRDSSLNRMDRSNSCFYFPYNPSMLFSAAIELQQRAAQNRELKRAHRYTQWGLGIAVAAIAVDALLALLDRLCGK